MGIFLLLGLSYPLYTAVNFVNCSRRAHGVIIRKDLYDCRSSSFSDTVQTTPLQLFVSRLRSFGPFSWNNCSRKHKRHSLHGRLSYPVRRCNIWSRPEARLCRIKKSWRWQRLVIQVLVVRPPICNRGHVYCTWKDSGNGVVRSSEAVQRSSLGICLAGRIWESEPNRDRCCSRLSVRRMLCWKRKLRGRVGGLSTRYYRNQNHEREIQVVIVTFTLTSEMCARALECSE